MGWITDHSKHHDFVDFRDVGNFQPGSDWRFVCWKFPTANYNVYGWKYRRKEISNLVAKILGVVNVLPMMATLKHASPFLKDVLQVGNFQPGSN
jgi:hypothetical protein